MSIARSRLIAVGEVGDVGVGAHQCEGGAFPGAAPTGPQGFEDLAAVGGGHPVRRLCGMRGRGGYQGSGGRSDASPGERAGSGG